MLDPGILGIGLDSLEGRLGAHALDLEFGHERHHVPGGALREDDGSLRREEAEGREVLDVVLIEEDVAREACAPHLLEQPLATRLQLFRRDAVTQLHALNHLSSTGDRWPIMHC